MKALRTPDDRFADLPDYPFAPHYVDVEPGLRMHYLDEGPRDGRAVLLLHGEPSWSYLYRKMLPVLVRAGLRCIAPDLIGFGKSDKPTEPSDYSYARHVGWVGAVLDALALSDVTLFCQDWGSLIGLRLVAERSASFARVVVANGFLPAGQGSAGLAFQLWRSFARFSPVFPVGRIVAAGCTTRLTARERAAYDAPFPSSAYQAGARVFPSLVPTRADDPAMPANLAAWERLGSFEKPFLALFGEDDPILGKADRRLIAHVPGAAGQPHERIPGGHFIQEDQGPHLAEAVARWVHATTARSMPQTAEPRAPVPAAPGGTFRDSRG